ncbi:MAG: TlpA family protein disulfide reductase [Clostridia bacterium]|nr:TlpA family protein disulfide reductase [Clostridia bacterium]
MKKLLVILLAAMLLLGVATAEEQLGDLPQRGLILPMTQADVDMGLEIGPVMLQVTDGSHMPAVYVIWNSPEAKAAESQMLAAQQSGDSEALVAAQETYRNNRYLLAYVYLIGPDMDESLHEMLKAATVDMGKNGDYEFRYEVGRYSVEDAALQSQLDAAVARITELLNGAEFQPIVFDESELRQMAGAFPAFETKDINGNTVTNDIFTGKKLTVVNIWGTYCGPCINEMPELAAWAAEMPEDVQIIGLVSDLASYEDTATVEKAKLICEKTGVAYLNLVANEDFYDLLMGVTGVPTTIFVDGQGNIVGEEIVGAYVPRYKEQVELLLNEQ